MIRRRSIAVVLAAALLVACVPPTGTGGKPGATGGGGKGGKSGAGAAGASQAAGGGTTGAPAGVASLAPIPPVPSGPSPLKPVASALPVAANGATLTGKVKAPSTFISDQGGGVVANNGGSVVANNGGSVVANNGAGYRLHAVDQVPLAGARVVVTDARGQQVLDAAGQPLVAIAGPDGTYAFTQALPARNLVLEVTLPGGRGTLRAIAPTDAASRARTDVELVGTLTTGYILNKYVRAQADPLATLDKLPADVEAATRQKADAALAAGTAAGSLTLPTRLTDADSLATIEALRQADAAFDGQMEVVKKLLVAAGLDDLGNGQIATQVGLRALIGMARTADGTVYFACQGDERVWRLDAEGRMRAAAGTGPSVGQDAGDLDGQPAITAKLHGLAGLLVDREGRLLLVESRRISRLEPDGRLKVLMRQPADWSAVGDARMDAQGTLHVLFRPWFDQQDGPRPAGGGRPVSTYVMKTPASLWRLPAGGEPAAFKTFDEAESRKLHRAGSRGDDGDGGLIFHTWQVGEPGKPFVVTIRRLDLASGALTDLAAAPTPGFRDQLGGTWRVAADGLAVTGPDGKRWALPKPMTVSGPGAFSLPDGALLADGGKLYRLGPQGVALIAGLAEPPTEADANAIPFEDVANQAADPAGRLRVYDRGTQRIWSIVPGGRGKVVGTVPEQGWQGLAPVQPAAEVIVGPARPTPEPTPDWPEGFPTPEPAETPEEPDEAPGPGAPASVTINDLTPISMCATADGATWWSFMDGSTGENGIMRLGADGKLGLAWRPPDSWSTDGSTTTLHDFAVADDGTLTLLLSRWGSEDAGPAIELVKPGQAGKRYFITETGDWGPYALVRFDTKPDGELVLTDDQHPFRWKPGGKLVQLGPADSYEFGNRYDARDSDLEVDARGRIYGADNQGVWRWDPASGEVKTIVGYDGLAFQGAGVNDGTSHWVTAPMLDAAGNLYFLDPGNRQVKRIPAAEIP